MPGGGGGDLDQGPLPQGGLPLPPANGSLKEMAPAIFNGNRRNMKQFTQEFTLYWMINQEVPTMQNIYTQMALALSFIRGQAINDWVMGQIERLFVKCNGNMGNEIPPTYCTNDEQLWVKFSCDFKWAFTNTTFKQCAYRELANCVMESKIIDEYIAHFKHLLQKVGWDRTSWGSLF